MSIRTITFALILATGANSVADAQCVGRVTENRRPPAVRGLSTTDPGFTVKYWAWDDFNRRRGGRSRPELVDTGRGILLSHLDWADADVCVSDGPVRRTAILFERLGEDGYGRWAIVNLGAHRSLDVDVDRVQRWIHPPSSIAAPVPSPEIVSTRVTDDFIEIRLSWSLDRRGEILSDLRDRNRMRLPSVRGYAMYVVNGPEATARPWDWTRARDAEGDAVNGYSTDTSATILLPRSLWHDVAVRFAVALTFDGNGDADGEDPLSRSVHGEYLGAPSPRLDLPPVGPGTDKRGRAVGSKVFLAAR